MEVRLALMTRQPDWHRTAVVAGVLLITITVAAVVTSDGQRSTPGRNKSRLVDLTLPTGSKLIDTSWAGDWDGAEYWDLALPFGQEVAAIRSQLPIGRDLQGLAWCLEDINNDAGYVYWRWGDARTRRMIDVGIYKLYSPLQKHGGVNIHKSGNVSEPCSP